MKFSVESDMDKCVDALAEVKAYCTWCRRTGICDGMHCRTCTKKVYYDESYSKLIPLDRLRVDMLAVDKMSRYIRERKLPDMSIIRKSIKYILLLVTAFMIAPVLLTLMFSRFARDTPAIRQELPAKYREMHEHVLLKVHRNIYDLDGDHAINCQDYAVYYKYIWEQEYPLYKDRAQITHNLNWENGMNHLFITIFTEDGRFYIEPQGSLSLYYMYDVWGDRFDPGCNRPADRNFWFKWMKLL